MHPRQISNPGVDAIKIYLITFRKNYCRFFCHIVTILKIKIRVTDRLTNEQICNILFQSDNICFSKIYRIDSIANCNSPSDILSADLQKCIKTFFLKKKQIQKKLKGKKLVLLSKFFTGNTSNMVQSELFIYKKNPQIKCLNVYNIIYNASRLLESLWASIKETTITEWFN